MATEQAGVNDMPDAWEREAWVAVTVTGGAQVAAWRPRPWLPGYLFGSHFFIVDGCGYLFREGFWENFGNFFGGGVPTFRQAAGTQPGLAAWHGMDAPDLPRTCRVGGMKLAFLELAAEERRL